MIGKIDYNGLNNRFLSTQVWSLSTLISNSLTNWWFGDLNDMAFELAKLAKLLDVVFNIVDSDAKEPVDHSLVEILKLKFGQESWLKILKLNFSRFWTKPWVCYALGNVSSVAMRQCSKIQKMEWAGGFVAAVKPRLLKTALFFDIQQIDIQYPRQWYFSCRSLAISSLISGESNLILGGIDVRSATYLKFKGAHFVCFLMKTIIMDRMKTILMYKESSWLYFEIW